jgi:hypothetical protein
MKSMHSAFMVRPEAYVAPLENSRPLHPPSENVDEIAHADREGVREVCRSTKFVDIGMNASGMEGAGLFSAGAARLS